jgi:hypothetical protein
MTAFAVEGVVRELHALRDEWRDQQKCSREPGSQARCGSTQVRNAASMPRRGTRSSSPMAAGAPTSSSTSE